MFQPVRWSWEKKKMDSIGEGRTEKTAAPFFAAGRAFVYIREAIFTESFTNQ